MSRKIVVAVKPMQDIRFNGIGDYFVDAEGAVHIEVGDTGSDASNLLILIHELVEYALVSSHGISLQDIENFGQNCKHEESEENLDAPYFEEHDDAMFVEEYVALRDVITWDEHVRNIERAWDNAHKVPK